MATPTEMRDITSEISGTSVGDLRWMTGVQARMDDLIVDSWPEFMLADEVAHRHWHQLYETFSEFQFALVEPDGETVVAAGNSLPLAWDGDPGELPDEGWDWALARGFEDQAAGRGARILCALSITVAADYRGKGISAQMVKAMRSIGRFHGFGSLIAPVRPNLKSQYPLIPMGNYASWQNEKGLPFDPWMRVHSRLGARIAKVCEHSMIIRGTATDWHQWTGLHFPESGDYVVPGGLTPMEMDRKTDCGQYLEPNVWMIHDLE